MSSREHAERYRIDMTFKTFMVLVFVIAILTTCFIKWVDRSDQYVDVPETSIAEYNSKIAETAKKVNNPSHQVVVSTPKPSSPHETYAINTIPETTEATETIETVLADFHGRSEEERAALYSDDRNYPNFYGRLYVPDAEIDVALYYGNDQEITDRRDSANIYTWEDYYGETIADHNNQEFRKLFDVMVGTKGYLQLANGDIVNIVCTNVFNGHNTVDLIVDENGEAAQGRSDYLMYTCRNRAYNVRICLWNKI